MINPKNNIRIKVAIHVLIWLLLCIVPYLLSSHAVPEFTKMLKFSWMPMVFYAFVFYANYFVLIEKMLFTNKIFLYVVINILLIVICTWAIFEIKHLISAIYPMPKPSHLNVPSRKPSITLFIYRDLLSMLIPVVASIAVMVTEKWTRAEIDKKESERENLNSELQHLKYQLQPHFFFNSLNNIYALIESSPVLAKESVHSLAQLMRYMLYETDNGYATLNDEIQFITQYINLMKLRVSDKTIISIDFPKQKTDHKIAPLLFITLIENAFKHGVSAKQPSEIYFSLSINESTVKFIAQNNNFPKSDNDKSGSGIGLNNIKKRLQLLYPDDYLFETKVEDGIFKVILTIDLNNKIIDLWKN